MFYRFRFESEIYPTLSRVPLHVRMKLDLTGVRISLKSWLGFSMEERTVVCHLPVETDEEKKAFCSYLDSLSRRYFGQEAALVAPAANPPWEDRSRLPDPVQAKGQEAEQPVTLEEWSQWHSCRRYALLKLSVSKNEPEQFFAALREFREESGKAS